MPALGSLVVLFDVDNTLIDGDRLKQILEARIRAAVGDQAAERFWVLYEEVRAETGAESGVGYVDVPETARRLERELEDAAAPAALHEAIFDLDFAALLFPGALQALAHAATFAVPAILSDGDQRFQRHKIRASGIEAAVDGRVLVTRRKERELDEVRARFPAEHYVLVDDRARIHAVVKAVLGSAVTTVHVRQGVEARAAEAEPRADLTLPSIGDFLALSAEVLLAAARGDSGG